MRRKALLFVFLLAFLNSWSQNPATIFTIPNRNVTLPCGSTCTQITAVVPNIKQTDNYVLTPMPYLPFAYSTPAGINVTTLIPSTFFDDWWTSKIPITFPFCFYGITYPTLLIGTNSAITFDTSRAATGSGYAIAATGGGIPNTTYAPAMIFGPYHDIDIDNAGIASTKIEYRIEGTAPNRRFIASYNDVPYFSGSCAGLYARHQMVLYEGTGIIEIYISSKPSCTAWNNGYAILGIQDHTRTQAVAAAGYNATVWGNTSMDTAFRFTPSGGANRFKSAQLLVNGTVVGTGDTSSIAGTPEKMNLTFNNVCPSSDSTAFVLKVTYGRCNDITQDVSFYDTVRVKKLTPTFSLSSVNSNCSGGGSITASVTGGTGTFNYALNGGSFQAGNVFSNLTAGTYVVTTQNPVTNCSFSQSVVLTLNNNLTINALPSDTSVCVGASFTPRITSAGTSYVWNGPGTFSSATVAQPVITPGTSGMFIVSTTQGPCTRRDTINVVQLPAPAINAGPDLTMINGDVVQIKATAGPGTYLWTPATGLTPSATVLQPSASPTQTTTYTLTATSTQGCVSKDDMKITVLNCVDPMDAFTPNGDGINDVWMVNLRACYTKAVVEVFNRYGNRVYRSDNYQNNWDGKYEGKNLPDGTYYYVITLDLINGRKTYVKGNVTILR